MHEKSNTHKKKNFLACYSTQWGGVNPPVKGHLPPKDPARTEPCEEATAWYTRKSSRRKKQFPAAAEETKII